MLEKPLQGKRRAYSASRCAVGEGSFCGVVSLADPFSFADARVTFRAARLAEQEAELQTHKVNNSDFRVQRMRHYMAQWQPFSSKTRVQAISSHTEGAARKLQRGSRSAAARGAGGRGKETPGLPTRRKCFGGNALSKYLSILARLKRPKGCAAASSE